MSSIDKPLDRALKAFPSEAPRMFLHVMGVLDLQGEGTVEVLSTETSPPVKMPDFVAKMSIPPGGDYILHVEFEAVWHSRTSALMARRGGSLAWQYGLRVSSIVLLVRPQGCPAELPTEGVYAVAETRTTHPFRVIRMWEMDPTSLLTANEPRVLPWAMLMNSTDNQVRELSATVLALSDEELTARLMVLGSIRYDREELERITGAPKMNFLDIVMQESSIVKWVRQEGKAEGKAEGIAGEARRLLQASLAVKYPGLESMPELNAIEDVRALESLLIQHVVASSDRTATERAIRLAGAGQQESANS